MAREPTSMKIVIVFAPVLYVCPFEMLRGGGLC